MHDPVKLDRSSSIITAVIGAPFEWCPITGGPVYLEDARQEGGTQGGEYFVADFWMARYPVTNAQYQAFVDDPDGFGNDQWWEFSPQAQQWHWDHPRALPTAFPGDDLPRTRVSWFDSIAFCAWLGAKLQLQNFHTPARVVRLPTEQEWQRAAIGDTGWIYPWGNEINKRYCNYGDRNGSPTPVNQYIEGKSLYGVMDIVGNVWEWCLTAWGKEGADTSGYVYRAMRGGAWNISNLEHLRADGRHGHSPRGQLNDGGVRVVYAEPWQ